MSVSPLVLLVLQIVASFVALGLLAHTVVAPRLRRLPPDRALSALLWIHVPRYIPLALLAPGQIGPDVSLAAVRTIAWGDFASAVFATAAIVALYVRGLAGLRWVRAFTLVSVLDIVVALTVGLGSAVYEHPLGVAWYVLTLYVPAVCVSQAMIVGALGWIPRPRTVLGGGARADDPSHVSSSSVAPRGEGVS